MDLKRPKPVTKVIPFPTLAKTPRITPKDLGKIAPSPNGTKPAA